MGPIVHPVVAGAGRAALAILAGQFVEMARDFLAAAVGVEAAGDVDAQSQIVLGAKAPGTRPEAPRPASRSAMLVKPGRLYRANNFLTAACFSASVAFFFFLGPGL